MSNTLLFAAGASSALVAGAAAGVRWEPPAHLLAALMAFAAGALTAALAYELFEVVLPRAAAPIPPSV